MGSAKTTPAFAAACSAAAAGSAPGSIGTRSNGASPSEETEASGPIGVPTSCRAVPAGGAADAATDPGCSCHAAAATRDWSGTGGPKARPRCQNRTWQRPPIEGTRVSAYRWIGPDLEISLRAQPGARTTEVQGIHGEAIK